MNIGSSYKWWILSLVMVTTFMAVLDTTIVNVGFPSIMKYFGRSLSEAQWVTTAYLLSMTLMLPTAAWFSERFGHKKVFIISLLIFSIGSLLCSLSPSLELLIAARVFEGLGCGLIQPIGMAIVLREFDRRQRGLAIGLWAVAVAASVSFGPFIGGELLTHYKWDSLFMVNVPIGLATVIAILFVMRKDAAIRTASAFDLKGFIMIGFSMPLLVLSLALGSSPSHGGWSSPLVMGSLVVSLLMLGGYIYHALHSENPILNIRIFRYRSFSIAVIGLMFLGIGLFAGNYLLALYLEHSLSYTALAAGSVFLPVGILQGTLAPFTGWLSRYTGNKILIVCGLVIMATYFFMSSVFDASTPHYYIMLTLYLRGVSIGMAFTAMNTVSMSEIPNELMSHASSIANTVKQISGSLGIALFTSLLMSRVAHHSDTITSSTAYIDGVSESFMIAGILTVVSIIPILLLRNDWRRKSTDETS